MRKNESEEMSISLSKEAQDFVIESRKAGKTVFLDLKDDQNTLQIKAVNKYRTTNYSLAAYLILKGFKLQEIVFDIPFIPQKGVFIFDLTPEIEDAGEDFMLNSTEISAQDFIRETNKLKHLLEDKMDRRGVYKYGYRKNIGRE